jgi:[ribosomal protein S5]-alanine N-acetyltransferase
MPVPIPVTPPDPELRDGVVELRPWRRDDLDVLIATRPSTERNVLAWLAAEDDRMQSGDGLTLVVIEREGGTPLGNIGLRVLAEDREVAEFAPNASPSAQEGAHAAAVRLLAAWALREWRLARLQLATLVDDAATQRAAEQAGFRREGVLRSWSEVDGLRRDMVMFSLLPGDL